MEIAFIAFPGTPFTSSHHFAAFMVAESVLVLVVLLVAIAYILLADRKIWAAVQIRRGPNVVGPWGLLQSFADLLKFVLKEPIIPAGANKGVFLLAPLVSCVLALAAWAVIPTNLGWVISDINVGILFIFAISSLSIYGIIMKRNGQAVEQISDFAGLSRTNPMLAFLFAMLLFSLAGVPPLAGFFGKWYVFVAAIKANLFTLAVIGVLTSVVGAYYYLSIVKTMYFDEPAGQVDPVRIEVKAVMAVTGVFNLLFALFAGPVVSVASAAAKSLF